ncbi:NUDIX domain-containing protein [Clostridium polynesiense]|uniref:NUDIX domain-containing protein n=1 Tax=Clostridium polynesiense TaxID=1325933 RepID=UPI00058DFAA5|nr:NUDIX domain-containing protein [Clostridium polynesiense]
MTFNYVLEQEIVKNQRKNPNISYREAVRAVIFKGSSIFMIRTNKGDYKFPGGGINKDETHAMALKREVEEETGYLINSINDLLGKVTEIKPDDYQADFIFKMESYFYLCDISNDKTLQNLDSYEADLDFTPVWISLDEVIYLNEKIINQGSKDENSWVHRETFVLKYLKEKYKSK